jgi:hypothetical protein
MALENRGPTKQLVYLTLAAALLSAVVSLLAGWRL